MNEFSLVLKTLILWEKFDRSLLDFIISLTVVYDFNYTTVTSLGDNHQLVA